MSNIFGIWNEQRMQSTFQRLQEENRRLRRKEEIDRAVVLACIVAVLLVWAFGGAV